MPGHRKRPICQATKTLSANRFQNRDSESYDSLVSLASSNNKSSCSYSCSYSYIYSYKLTDTMSDASDNKPAAAPVDETPISPVRRPDHERKNSLENHLMHRPDRAELVGSALTPLPSPRRVRRAPNQPFA